MTYQPRYRIQGQVPWIDYGSPVTDSPVVVSGLPGGITYEFEVVAFTNNLQYTSQIVTATLSPSVAGLNTFFSLTSNVGISDWSYLRASFLPISAIGVVTLFDRINAISSINFSATAIAAQAASVWSTDFSTQFGT